MHKPFSLVTFEHIRFVLSGTLASSHNLSAVLDSRMQVLSGDASVRTKIGCRQNADRSCVYDVVQLFRDVPP